MTKPDPLNDDDYTSNDEQIADLKDLVLHLSYTLRMAEGVIALMQHRHPQPGVPPILSYIRQALVDQNQCLP